MKREDLDTVLETLETAVSTIRSLHAVGLDKASEARVWTLYMRSPEMQRINATIAMIDAKIRELNTEGEKQ